jgi:CRP/FNR family cyclic AMP-dependent transcriptional regulator
VEVFKPLLGGERLRELALSLPEVRLGRGESFRTADYAGAFFVVLEGRVRVYAVLRERELTLLVAGPAEIFGPAGSGGAMPQEWVRAMKPARIAIMSCEVFEELVMERPEVGMRMVDLLGKRLALYREVLANVCFGRVRERLSRLILQLARREGVRASGEIKIRTRYTHRELGTMIGANREAVTNTLLQLRRAGVVKMAGRHIHVVDIRGLERLAGGDS